MTDNDYKLQLEKYGGWILIIVFCLIPVTRWLTIEGNIDTLSGANGMLSGFGKLTGIIGLVLYAINLLLAARTRWMESFFGGLNRVYIAHHLTGGIALILLIFHPLFLAFKQISLAELTTLKDAALYLLPRSMPFDKSFFDVQQAAAINAGIAGFVGMVFLLILTFFVKLPYRLWLFTHKFLGVAFMFAGLHVVLIDSDVASDSLLKVYLLSWICVGIVAFGYRTLMNNVFVRRAPYKVVKIDNFDSNVVGITLDAMEKPIDYRPGQFVFIRFLWSTEEGIIKEAHPFSIASSPNEKNLRLMAKSLGDFTSSIKNLKVGTIAEIEGAYGRFTYTRFGNAPQIWIAGGIGVTPFLSMARSYNEKSPPVSLVYSVVKKTELLDQQALKDYIPSKFSTFTYLPYVAEEQDGFLTAEKIETMCDSLVGKEIFICGPPPMMKALREQLRARGVPNSKIHTEEFSMS